MLAKQAAGSCLVQYRRNGGADRRGHRARRGRAIDFFPLTCDYRERTAAAGKFPGGFLKREGRPTMKETLTSRLMDRPIRPLFPAWFHDEVQIQSFVVGQRPAERRRRAGHERRLGRLGLSPLPFQGPIALGSAGPYRRPIRPVPHAGRTGRERSRPDRLRQQGRGADDRRLCPRDARRADARGDRRVPADHRRDLRLAARAVRQGRRRKSSSTRPAAPDGVYEQLKRTYYDALQAGQADRGQAGPGRGRRRAQGAGRGRDDSRSDAPQAPIAARQLRPCLARSWKSRSSAI